METRMNYQDHWGRFHDKPVTEDEPLPSNNGYIYTAYYRKVAGISVPDYIKLEQCFQKCLIDGKFVLRSPGKITPYLSRDEVLGGVYLSLVKPHHLNGWNFYGYPLPKFSLVKLLKQLWELRPSCGSYYFDQPLYIRLFDYLTGPTIIWKHRNYFWQNNLDQIYRFAFSVPVQDRHFILKCWHKFQWYNPVHLLYAAIAKVDSLLPKKSGIKWLKYGGEENLKAMVKEFPVNHPIRVKVGF